MACTVYNLLRIPLILFNLRSYSVQYPKLGITMSNQGLSPKVTREQVLSNLLQYSIDTGDLQRAERMCADDSMTMQKMDYILRQNIVESYPDAKRVLDDLCIPSSPKGPEKHSLKWFVQDFDIVRSIPADPPSSKQVVLMNFIIPLHIQYKRLSGLYFQESQKDIDSSERDRVLSSLYVDVPTTFAQFDRIVEPLSGLNIFLTEADKLGRPGDLVLMEIAFQFIKHRDLLRFWANRFKDLGIDSSTCSCGVEREYALSGACLQTIADFDIAEERKREGRVDRFSLKDLDRICDWQGHTLAKRVINAKVEHILAGGSLQ